MLKEGDQSLTESDGAYLFRPAYEVQEESKRLDEMHAAFSVYLRGELSFAPMAEVLPRKILDLGASTTGVAAAHGRLAAQFGLGISTFSALCRAIQAAKQFPEAEVHAIDISPLPNRIFPSNIHFQLADLTQELNFETETFTIVHARLVMCHVSNGKDVIERAARLVRPSGLLLIEDLDISNLVSTGGPAVKRFISTLIQLATARGGDMEIGRKLEGIITSLGVFEDINVTEITVPLSGTGSDSANELGLALKKSFASLDLGIHGQWMTASVLQQYREEIGYSGCESIIYFSWARRSVT
ncbi:hypothetical protein B0H13DRAFT_2327600 [Mycena leptocephala]|nr:hypothetical protein B0H13DRAFT_2327600 [Mycena leptocephala]